MFRVQFTYSNVGTSVAREKSDSTHQILRTAHLSNGDERSPLLLKRWVVVKDLLGSKFTLV